MDVLPALVCHVILVVMLQYILDDRPVVSTNCGLVEGQLISGAYSFRGIPYAMPPVGTRRWRQPEPLSPASGNCWNGTYKASSFGNTCFQIDPEDPNKYLGSEDCLYLNVITPEIDPPVLKPVMVWIHGGSLQLSSGSWPLYTPTEKLANSTQVVYVSFNYRLHAFGFMALQELADLSPFNTSGNYGFHDMVAVLRWVQINIRHFGGDPNQVTVFGQSSGGTAIFALLAAPVCQGLFHKAWLLSASAILNKTADDAYNDNRIFMTRTGCTDINCLYNLTSAQVTQAVPWDVYPYWAMKDQLDVPTRGMFDGALAIIDGDLIPVSPFEAWSSGTGVDVPLLIGSCANEVDYMPFDNAISVWTWSQYQQHINSTIGTFGADILQIINELYPMDYLTPEYQVTSLASDIRSNCPNDVLSLRAASGYSSPVYRYVVTSWPSVPVHALGQSFPAKYSFHMWDVFAFFGFIPDYIKDPTGSDLQFQQTVQSEVLTFIQTGKPASFDWKPFPANVALLNSTIEIVDAFHSLQCEFLLKNGFFDYSWIN